MSTIGEAQVAGPGLSMKQSYTAVEVSAPGVFRVVERPLREGRARFGFAWKPAASVTAMP
jgi:hypothetical protein